MSICIKSHNVAVLMCHIVFTVKYKRVVIDDNVGRSAHCLIQSIPSYSITAIVTMVKSLTAREMFKSYPDVKAIVGRRVLVKWVFC